MAASHAVVAEAKAAGVWIWGGGLERQKATVVGTDGSVADGHPRGCTPLGGQAGCRVPLCARGPRDHVRPRVLIAVRTRGTRWCDRGTTT